MLFAFSLNRVYSQYHRVGENPQNETRGGIPAWSLKGIKGWKGPTFVMPDKV